METDVIENVSDSYLSIIGEWVKNYKKEVRRGEESIRDTCPCRDVWL